MVLPSGAIPASMVEDDISLPSVGASGSIFSAGAGVFPGQRAAVPAGAIPASFVEDDLLSGSSLWGSRAAGAVSGLSFGLADEVGSYGNALIDEGLELFGLAEPATFGQRQESYQEGFRDRLKEYQQQRPIESLAVEAGAGMLLPGGQIKAAKSLSNIQKLKRAAKIGAGYGGLAGFGYAEGGASERAVGAAIGAGAGATLGGIAEGVLAGGGALLKSQAGNEVREWMATRLADEVGAIGNWGDDTAKLTKAQKAILKTFESATDDEILAASERIALADKSGTPITLVEALDIPQGYIDAKTVRTSRGGQDVAEKFLQERRKGVASRIGAILDDISPEDDVFFGSGRLQRASEDIIDTMEGARTKVTKPLYEAAEKEAGGIIEELGDSLLKLPVVQDAIQAARKKYARNLTPNLPDNHYKVLQETQKELNSRIARALKNEDMAFARELTLIKGKIEGAISKQSPKYRQAQSAYETISRSIDRLAGGNFGGKKAPGLIEDVLRANSEKPGQAARALMSKSPTQLKEVRKTFERYGRIDDLRAGVRAAFQDELDRIKGGVLEDKGGARIDRLFGQSNTREKLNALLGEAETNQLWNRIDLEGRIAKGESQIGVDLRSVGSPTEPLRQNREGFLQKISQGIGLDSLAETAAKVFKGDEDEQLMAEIAEKMFSTVDPDEFGNFSRFLSRYNNWKRSVDTAANTAAVAADKAGAISGGSLQGEGGAARIGTIFGATAATAPLAASVYPPSLFQPNADSQQQPSGGSLFAPKATEAPQPPEQLPASQQPSSSSGLFSLSQQSAPSQAPSQNPIEAAFQRMSFGPEQDSQFANDFTGESTVTENSEVIGSLVEAVIQQESAGKPNAVSPKGAQGLMQLMPATGREMMQELGMDPRDYDPFDPELNVTLGTAYLQKLYDMFGDEELALAAYNWGMGNVRKAMRKANSSSWEGIKHLAPTETKKYVPMVLKRREKLIAQSMRATKEV